MASIFDQARSVLKNLQGKAKAPQPVQNPTNQYQSPTSFWNTSNPVANALLGLQKATPAYKQQGQQAFGNNFFKNNLGIQNYVPQLQAPKMNNPLVQKAANFGAGLINLPVQAAAMTFTPIANLGVDLGTNIGNKYAGKGATSYQYLKSPFARLEYNALGQNNSKREVASNLAAAGLDVLNMSTLGVGKKVAMSAAKANAEKSFFQAVKTGSFQGGAFMGGAGFLQGISDNKNAKTILEQFQKGGEEGFKGALLGAVSGGMLSGGGHILGKLLIRTPQVEKQLRDEIGRYAVGKTPVKPKGMAKAAWDFQIKFNKQYKRNPYTPVYADDVKRAATFELEKRGAGMSIRDVTKDENPLGTNNTIQPQVSTQQPGSQLLDAGNPQITSQQLLPDNGVVSPEVNAQSQIDNAYNATVPKAETPSPLAGSTNLQTTQLKETLKPQVEAPKLDTSPQGQTTSPINPSSDGGSIPQSDPVQKIIQALKEAKPIRKEQEALYRAERAKRAAIASSMGSRIGGEQGYYAQLGALKGELKKVQFEGIRDKLTSNDINSVFQKVEDVPYFSTFEKITAKTGLAKLLGKEGGTVPTKGELALLNEIFPPEFIEAAMGNRTALQKIWSGIGQVAAVPRSLMAGGLDMSYGLRQGVFSGYRHPKQWASAFKEQFKYFASEKALTESKNAIKAHPNYKLAREAGLAITDLGSGNLNPREEQFQSALAEKIPGIGSMVRASGRAYTGFANKYRFDMFNDLVAQAKKTGDFDDPNFLKSAGELVNTLTGRGSLGPLERSAGTLSSTLFSPRLLASRLQLMNPQFYMKLQPAARKRALESLVAYVAGTGTILGAAKLAGADVSTDPTNSDFAKIKVGNTRVDIMGGFQQPIVLLARLLTGKVTSSTTGKTMTLGEGYKPMTRFDMIQRFFESKESPIASFIVSATKGKDAIGNDFNLPAEIVNRMVPMLVSDLVDLYRDGGLASMPLAIPAFFGTGAQTYGKTELVTGKNKLGEPTSQVRPLQGIGETVTETVFGKQPLGSSGSTNVATYYDQMLKMPKQEAAAKFNEIAKTNPELAKSILQVYKDRQKGVTVDDQVMKTRGVSSGDRALSIADEFNKLRTPQEKAALWEHYVKVGVITKDVAKQLVPLLKK